MVEELNQIYSDIGYKCVEISALENINIDVVKGLMKDKVTMFSGHSIINVKILIILLTLNIYIPTTPLSKFHYFTNI